MDGSMNNLGEEKLKHWYVMIFDLVGLRSVRSVLLEYARYFFLASVQDINVSLTLSF